MENIRKRNRSVNFSLEETERLVSLIESSKEIIENKKSDSRTWLDKENAWKAIEVEFNISVGGIFRGSKHLKGKYEAMKRDIRKKTAIIRAEKYKTDGDTNILPTLTPIEMKIMEIILLSIEGEKSIYDSDQISTSEINEDADGIIDSSLENDENYSSCLKKIKKEEVICFEEVKLENMTVDQTNSISIKPMWQEWSSTSLKTKKHPALRKPKVNGPFEKLEEVKVEVACLQKQLIAEKLKEKSIQNQILEEEKHHKRQMNELEKWHKNEIQELEKRHLLLKVEKIKMEITNLKAINN